MGWLSGLWNNTKATIGKALNFGGNILKHAGEWGGKVLKVAGEWAPALGDIASSVGLAMGQPEIALAAQGVAGALEKVSHYSNSLAPVADKVAGFGGMVQKGSDILGAP